MLAENLDELAQGDEAARRSFVSWGTSSPRHLEEAFRIIELNATLNRMWDRKRERRSKTVLTNAPKTDWMRTIRKYPNRRLYDMVESPCITLSDIRRLVLKRVDFVVIEKKRARKTLPVRSSCRSSLSRSWGPIMARDFLSQIIRSYGGARRQRLASFCNRVSNSSQVNNITPQALPVTTKVRTLPRR